MNEEKELEMLAFIKYAGERSDELAQKFMEGGATEEEIYEFVDISIGTGVVMAICEETNLLVLYESFGGKWLANMKEDDE
ncbi:hypothetical protein NNG48_07120 [Enterococcus faecium]|nr:hypothetical protein [Enterococcus faecium]